MRRRREWKERRHEPGFRVVLAHQQDGKKEGRSHGLQGQEGRKYIETLDSAEWLTRDGTLGEEGTYRTANDLPYKELDWGIQRIANHPEARICEELGSDEINIWSELIAGGGNSVDRIDVEFTVKKKFREPPYWHYKTPAHEWVSIDVHNMDFESILREVDRKAFRTSLRRVEKMLEDYQKTTKKER